MQVTKRSEYAILSALYLAKKGGMCDIGEIAASHGLSVAFVAKALQGLSKAGIVTSRRGQGGGYTLARPAEAINLLELVEAVEGPVAISDCLKEGASCTAAGCELKPVWETTQRLIRTQLAGTTLAGLLTTKSDTHKNYKSDMSDTRGTIAAPVILCDFDGTISKQDVSDAIFTIWLGEKWTEIDREWHDGRISMVELYRKCWELVEADEADISDFVDTVEIDSFFAEFIEQTRASDVPVYLVSDGFDYFIERVMGRHGLSDLTYHANHLSFVNGKLVLGFNNQHAECIQCANCKKAVMDAQREGAGYVIYIGNGLSDRCAAEHADLVFAKDSLLEYCRNNGIDCIAYEHFGEIIGHLRERSILKGLDRNLDRDLERCLDQQGDE
ncbi:MAG: MtnX-like HAD-IB family phosphatase [Candidatus Aquicultor sp.]